MPRQLHPTFLNLEVYVSKTAILRYHQRHLIQLLNAQISVKLLIAVIKRPNINKRGLTLKTLKANYHIKVAIFTTFGQTLPRTLLSLITPLSPKPYPKVFVYPKVLAWNYSKCWRCHNRNIVPNVPNEWFPISLGLRICIFFKTLEFPRFAFFNAKKPLLKLRL